MLKPCMILLAVGLLFQTTVSRAVDCSAGPRQPETRGEIQKLGLEWSQAYWTGNTRYLECLYDARFKSAEWNGILHDRAQDIAGSVKYVGRTWRPHGYAPTIVMYASYAISTNVKFKPGDTTHGFRDTEIYAYDGKHWHAIFAQDSKF